MLALGCNEAILYAKTLYVYYIQSRKLYARQNTAAMRSSSAPLGRLAPARLAPRSGAL